MESEKLLEGKKIQLKSMRENWRCELKIWNFSFQANTGVSPLAGRAVFLSLFLCPFMAVQERGKAGHHSKT